jgi:hypothetical protein
VKRFLTFDRMEKAPNLPHDRPPTRREVWDREHALYNGLKTHDEMKLRAKSSWVYAYCRWFNLKGWRKQPDWVEGDPVIEDAVPNVEVLYWADVYENERILYACLERARERRAA